MNTTVSTVMRPQVLFDLDTRPGLWSLVAQAVSKDDAWAARRWAVGKPYDVTVIAARWDDDTGEPCAYKIYARRVKP